MKPPKRLSQILKRKEQFLDEVRSKLENTTLRLQVNLFEQIISEIIPRLDVENGVIVDNAHNYQLISELDRVYNTFNSKVAGTILPQVNKGLATIAELGTDYFTLALTDLPARFAKIIEGAKVLTDLRIGLRSGKMIRGGTFESMLKIESSAIKQLLSKAVTSQMDTKEFISIIKENINGTDEKIGALERQFNRFTYDTYQQYDRSYNKKLAEEFNMKYFLYQGNLIKDSRDFCAAHNNKVWSVEETEAWRTWTPDQGEYPEGYEIKAKNPGEVPSYLTVDGYDPITDLGGPNCRHIYAPISDDLAFKLRPELKNKK